jgi:hypothetical protein
MFVPLCFSVPRGGGARNFRGANEVALAASAQYKTFGSDVQQNPIQSQAGGGRFE